jgi:hypothetical protein
MRRWPTELRAEYLGRHPDPSRSVVTVNRLPGLFVAHGAPTFAIDPGLAGPKLTALGQALPRPRSPAQEFQGRLTARP